ncbi:hypothetical protein H8959_014333 [Pygathrix nigripes]
MEASPPGRPGREAGGEGPVTRRWPLVSPESLSLSVHRAHSTLAQASGLGEFGRARVPPKDLVFSADSAPPPILETLDPAVLEGKGEGVEERFGSGRRRTPENRLPGGSRLSSLS